MRRFTADEQIDVRRNLAVPSPIFKDTDPIFNAVKERRSRAQAKV
jgi:hypothetical protein